MTALASLPAMLAGLARDLPGLWAPSGPSALTALAATILAGAMLAAVLALVASCVSRSAVPIPMISRASALREKSWRAAFLRQCDPDAPGRARPRAPSAAQAAAVPA